MLEAAPILIRNIKEDKIKLNILMFGGGPAIRGRTYRVFHKHDTNVVLDEIVSWAKEGNKAVRLYPMYIGSRSWTF